MSFFTNRYEKMIAGFKPVIPEKKYVRINTLKGDEKEIVARLEAIDVKLTPTPLTLCYAYEAAFALSSTTEHLLGLFYIQDLASQTVAHALAPKPEWTIIDMAAAPGSKTTHIAQLMKNGEKNGKIIALDNNPNRLIAVRNNCERLGITNVIAIKKDARYVHELNIEADAVLLDAPCSGNYCSNAAPQRRGSRADETDAETPKVMADEWFAKRTLADIKQNARVQKDLLKAAIQVLKTGGTLIYSTCSLEPEEDELVIDWALKRYPALKLEKISLPTVGLSPGLVEFDGEKLEPDLMKTVRSWPHLTGTEGFFIAKLRKGLGK